MNKHEIHTHPGSEILYNLPLYQVIVNEEFKHPFKWYQEIPNKPGYIIVKRSEYLDIKYGYSR